MPPFVGFRVELCRELPVGFRRYYWGDATVQQVIAQPIRVKGPVGQQMPGGQAADQCIGLAQIMGLPWHQTEIDEVAERVRQGQFLRRYPSARATNGLAESRVFQQNKPKGDVFRSPRNSVCFEIMNGESLSAFKIQSLGILALNPCRERA